MFFKKKLVEGFCKNCNSIKQGYQEVFLLGRATGISFLIYLSLGVGLGPDKVEPTWLLALIAGLIVYKFYIGNKNKKRCFTCNNELIEQ